MISQLVDLGLQNFNPGFEALDLLKVFLDSITLSEGARRKRNDDSNPSILCCIV